MDYCTLEDAWGVKTFRTQLPAPAPRHCEPIQAGRWPVSGPFGYRQAAPAAPFSSRSEGTGFQPGQDTAPSGLHPVALAYMQDGVEGLLRVLPDAAIDELRARLVVGGLNVVAGVLLAGFVMLLLWDVLLKRR